VHPINTTPPQYLAGVTLPLLWESEQLSPLQINRQPAALVRLPSTIHRSNLERSLWKAEPTTIRLISLLDHPDHPEVQLMLRRPIVRRTSSPERAGRPGQLSSAAPRSSSSLQAGWSSNSFARCCSCDSNPNSPAGFCSCSTRVIAELSRSLPTRWSIFSTSCLLLEQPATFNRLTTEPDSTSSTATLKRY